MLYVLRDFKNALEYGKNWRLNRIVQRNTSDFQEEIFSLLKLMHIYNIYSHLFYNIFRRLCVPQTTENQEYFLANTLLGALEKYMTISLQFKLYYKNALSFTFICMQISQLSLLLADDIFPAL